MDDAALVRGFERRRNLKRDLQRVFDRQAAPCGMFGGNPIGQRLAPRRAPSPAAAGQPIPPSRKALRYADGSVTRALCFTLEPRDAVEVRRHCLGKHLECDAAPELCVTRAINFAHAAGAERRDDLVRAEACTGGQGHGDADSRPSPVAAKCHRMRRDNRRPDTTRSITLRPLTTDRLRWVHAGTREPVRHPVFIGSLVGRWLPIVTDLGPGLV